MCRPGLLHFISFCQLTPAESRRHAKGRGQKATGDGPGSTLKKQRLFLTMTPSTERLCIDRRAVAPRVESDKSGPCYPQQWLWSAFLGRAGGWTAAGRRSTKVSLSSLSGRAEQTLLFALKQQRCRLVTSALRLPPGSAWLGPLTAVPAALTRELVGDSHFIT